MCVGAWTIDHPDYALILCTNRDEFLARPTQDAHFHSFQDINNDQCSSLSGRVLSGRDIEAGGSWFGLNRSGNVALLTNITEAPQEFKFSRGHLVSSFLLSDSPHLLEEVSKILPQDAKIAGFNLVLFAPSPPFSAITEQESDDLEKQEQESITQGARRSSWTKNTLMYDAMLVTNHGAGGPLKTRRLSSAEKACGCISNGIDGQGGNEWPKVKILTHAFKSVLDQLPTTISTRSIEAELVENLFHILAWQSPEPITDRSQLRNTVHVTAVPVHIYPRSATTLPARDKAVSANPIMSFTPPASLPAPSADKSKSETEDRLEEPYYATRLSTILLIRRDGSVLFIERDIWKFGDEGQPERSDLKENTQRVFEFHLDLRSENCD